MRQGQGQEQAGDGRAPAHREHHVARGQQPRQREEATESGKDKSEQSRGCGCGAGSEHGIGCSPGSTLLPQTCKDSAGAIGGPPPSLSVAFPPFTDLCTGVPSACIGPFRPHSTLMCQCPGFKFQPCCLAAP